MIILDDLVLLVLLLDINLLSHVIVSLSCWGAGNLWKV